MCPQATACGKDDLIHEQEKAIIIYNGQAGWDPLAEIRSKYKGQFNGRELPFECVLVNLADISDEACFGEPNVEVAVGALVMKHAFDADGLKSIVDKLIGMLSRLENGARATLAKKIVVYFQKTLRLGNGNDAKMAEYFRSKGVPDDIISGGLALK